MDDSRRKFLKWMGVAPAGSLMLLHSACGGVEASARGDGGVDGGRSRTDGGSSSDTGGGTTDTGSGGTDAGYAQDARQQDLGGTADAGDVDAGSQPDVGETCEPTGSDVEGPFHIDGAPNRTVLADANEPGERIIVDGVVYGPDCRTPLAGVMLDVWHADDNGDYDDSTTEYRLRGQMTTDDQGRYQFETIKPGRYPLGNSTRPAHIHFIVAKPGYLPLTTQMYFEGDPFLKPNDPCGNGCNSGDPTLIVPFSEQNGTVRGSFDIVLRRP